MTSRRIQSHKDYRMLMEKHKRTSRGRRLLRSLIYILIFLGLILLIYYGMQKLSPAASDEGQKPASTEQISRPGLKHIVEFKP